eukprot:6214678-Pleurochrysis_carterae.AAC.2
MGHLEIVWPMSRALTSTSALLSSLTMQNGFVGPANSFEVSRQAEALSIKHLAVHDFVYTVLFTWSLVVVQPITTKCAIASCNRSRAADLHEVTEQPLQGRAQFESVVKTDSLEPRTASVRGGQERRHNYVKYNQSRAGSKRVREGWGAPARWLKKGALKGQRRPSRAKFQELEERSASAPQVPCGANAIWATMHVSVEPQKKGERDDSL